MFCSSKILPSSIPGSLKTHQEDSPILHVPLKIRMVTPLYLHSNMSLRSQGDLSVWERKRLKHTLATLKCEKGQFTAYIRAVPKASIYFFASTDTCLAATYSRTIQCWIILCKSHMYNYAQADEYFSWQ